METKRVKSLTFMGGAPIDIYDGWADVFVTLEDDDDLEYLFEVTTPQHMDERNQNPFIIVRDIKEALEAFIIQKFRKKMVSGLNYIIRSLPLLLMKNFYPRILSIIL